MRNFMLVGSLLLLLLGCAATPAVCAQEPENKGDVQNAEEKPAPAPTKEPRQFPPLPDHEEAQKALVKDWTGMNQLIAWVVFVLGVLGWMVLGATTWILQRREE